jgi:ribosome-associated translation inhibitor RaiA
MPVLPFYKLGSIALISGAACVGHFFGGPLASGLFGGMLTNLASTEITKVPSSKLLELIRKMPPSKLNHDLEKLISEALIWTIENIVYLYDPYANKKWQKRSLKKAKAILIKEVTQASENNLINKQEVLKVIDEQSNEDLLKQFFAQLDSLPKVNFKHPFTPFFEEKFLSNFKLCFGELLKAPENRKSLIAYNRNLMNAIKESIAETNAKLDGIDAVTQKLEALVDQFEKKTISDIQTNVEASDLVVSINSIIDPLSKKIDLLVDSNGQIIHLLEEQHHLIDNVLQKVRIRRLVYTITITASLAVIVFLAIRYWYSLQPVLFSVQLQSQTRNEYLPKPNPSVTLFFNGKSEVITGSMQPDFKNLNYAIKGSSVRVLVEATGFQTIDTSFVYDENFISLNVQRDDTYERLFGTVTNGTGKGIAAKIKLLDTIYDTDSLGNFDIKIPLEQQRKRHRLLVTAKEKGYLPWDRIETVIKNEPTKIVLENE